MRNCIAALITALMMSATAALQAADRPNIVLIVSDDQGYGLSLIHI